MTINEPLLDCPAKTNERGERPLSSLLRLYCENSGEFNRCWDRECSLFDRGNTPRSFTAASNFFHVDTDKSAFLTDTLWYRRSGESIKGINLIGDIRPLSSDVEIRLFGLGPEVPRFIAISNDDTVDMSFTLVIRDRRMDVHRLVSDCFRDYELLV